MTDQEIAQAAAERWGDRDPTFDDVIQEHTPKYGEEPAHTRRWHRIKDIAFDLAVTPNRCEYCGKVLVGKIKGRRRYCDAKCVQEAYVEREAKRSA